MPDDILATVKAALVHIGPMPTRRGKYSDPCAKYGHKVLQFIYLPRFAMHWLRALVARVEQAEAENARLRHIDRLYDDACQAIPFNLAGPEDEVADVLKRALAALAALREQRCEACRHRIEPDTRCSIARCAKLSVPGHSVAMVTCAAVNYRCGAWARREP